MIPMTNQSIDILVKTDFLEDRSNPAHDQYVFTYTIKIKNKGDTGAKLIGRHWIITNADGLIEEVKGPGVVGHQPHIKAGEEYQYTSGAILNTPVGSMHGCYYMITDDGLKFETPITPFSLATPNILH